MLQRLATGTALLAGLFCTAAWSLGLGDIQVSSRLNQPLTATISLTSLSEEDAESLRVQLASPADFEKAGIERSDYVASLKFSVSGNKVRISSGEIAREPYIALLVEARAGGSRVLRGYTVLLDLPPSASAGQPPASAASAEPQSDAAESARQQQPKTYGPIRSGQTFWSVATKLRPDPALVSQDQTMLALYTANPQAFLGGINGLLIGSTLQVPSVDDMRSVPELEARRRVQALRAASSAPGAAVAAPVKPAAVVAAETPPPAVPVVEAETPITAAAPSDTAAAAPAPVASTEAPAEAAPTPAVEAPPAAVDVTTPSPESSSGDVTPAADETAAPPAAAEAPVAPPVVAPAAPTTPELPLYPLLGALMLLVLLALFTLQRRRARKAAPPSTMPIAATAAVAAAAEAEVSPPASAPPPVADSEAESVAVVAPPVVEILSEAPSADAEVPPPEFDESQPVEIDLSSTLAGEPSLDQLDAIAEADFHLSYGLYDEAVRGLQEAITREPDRNDLQIKLAETYFAAGRPDDFEALAQRLQPRLGPSDWSRLVFMGSQLCPDSALFRDADAERLIDAPIEAPMEIPIEAPHGNEVEFSLEPPPGLPPPITPAPIDTGNRLEFELSEFDANAPVDIDSWHSPVPPQTQWQPSSSSVAPAVLDLANPGVIEFDALPDIDPNDIDLFDPEPEVEIATDDEVGTKLDLARAYLDMGDQQMARDLLAEVAVQGTPAQQADADVLLRRLPL